MEPQPVLQVAPPDERVLIQRLRSLGAIAIGFSGGVDSAYLAVVATQTLGAERVLAILGRSASVSGTQYATARDVARQFGVRLVEIDTDEMNDPRYAANPVNRCYFCKTELWSRVVPVARAHGLATVADGTNADDGHDHRPGLAAAREHGIVSPLAEAGLTKADIRALSRDRGMPTWDQPSSPCLSSRVTYGIRVTPDRLARIERAELALRALGVAGDLRVRDHDDLARVEIARAELAAWLAPAARTAVARAVREAGFTRVAIDLRGYRSGSLNVLGGVRVA